MGAQLNPTSHSVSLNLKSTLERDNVAEEDPYRQSYRLFLWHRLTKITPTAIELFIVRIWHRTRATARKTPLKDVPPALAVISVSRPSSASNRLPQEIVEMIISHLFNDKYRLLACCLTCCSWYIAAAPHLHQTLITPPIRRREGLHWWPDSFRKMHDLGLLPFVKRFHVTGSICLDFLGPITFLPELFDHHALCHYFSLTNVRDLGIDDLDIPSFMPNIRRYFHHFLPTVRSLSLRKPRGSHRHITFFIGLFKHLEDLKLSFIYPELQGAFPDDLALVPPFAPPLRGRLKMEYFAWDGSLQDMIGLFGGFRFRHLDLVEVENIQLLLDTCAETLETFRFDPGDPQAKSFDLSQHKSLRALEFPMVYLSHEVQHSPLSVASTLKHVLSTIMSRVFSEVTILYRRWDLPCCFQSPLRRPPMFIKCWPYRTKGSESEHRTIFKMTHEMRKVRNFRLVLCADVWGGLEEHAVRELNLAVNTGWVEESDDVSSRPIVTCRPLGFPAPGYERLTT